MSPSRWEGRAKRGEGEVPTAFAQVSSPPRAEEAVNKCKTPFLGRRIWRFFCSNDGLKRPSYE